MSRVFVSMLFILCLVFPLQASAGLFGSIQHWVGTEVIPTIKGDRPLVIKDHVTVTSADNKIKLHVDTNDNFQLRIGDVNMSTHELSVRLVQAGCVIATNGDVMTCAPDIVERELLNIADGINSKNPSSIPTSMLPQYSVSPPNYGINVIPTGTPMQACGCWGFNPSPIAYEPRCVRSRVGIAQCPGWCNAGGVPYGYICM